MTIKRKMFAKPTAPNDEARGYTDADMAEVMDFPELTDTEIATAKPFAEVFPAMAASIRHRGKQKAPTKVPVSLRLDRDVVEAFKKNGPGWQVRMGAALRKSVGL